MKKLYPQRLGSIFISVMHFYFRCMTNKRGFHPINHIPSFILKTVFINSHLRSSWKIYIQGLGIRFIEMYHNSTTIPLPFMEKCRS